MDEIHVGDVGAELVLTAVGSDGSTPEDVSAATAIQFYLRSPSGSVLLRDGELDGDGTDGKVKYTTAAGDLTEPGVWHAQVRITVGGQPFGTGVAQFSVASNIYDQDVTPPDASDLPVGVPDGGTGATSFAAGTLLGGNGAGPVAEVSVGTGLALSSDTLSARLVSGMATDLVGYPRGDGSTVSARSLSRAVGATGGTSSGAERVVRPSGSDDTDRIQAALDAVAAAGGGVVRLAAGDFTVSEPLTCSTSGVQVVGCGEATRILKSHATGDLFDFAPASTPVDSDGEGLSGIRFADFYVEASSQGTAHTSGACIRVAWSNGCKVERVRIGTSYAYTASGSPPLYDGIVLEQQGECLIDGCRIYTRHDGIAVSGQGFLSGQLGASGFPHFGFNGLVRACTLYSKRITGSVGIRLGGGTGGFGIVDTDVGYWETGLRVDKTMRAESNRELFLGPRCFLDNSGGDGLYIDQESLRHLHWPDCWVAGSVGWGINLHATQHDPTDVVIAGGRAYRNGGGVFMNAGRWTLSGLVVNENTGTGLRIDANADGCLVSGCRIVDNTATGLEIASGADGYQITGNLFDGNGATIDDDAAGANGRVVGNLGAYAESGQAVLASDFAITAANGTFEDTGLEVALPAPGTYRITYNVRSNAAPSSGTGFICVRLYDETAAAEVADSPRLMFFPASSSLTVQVHSAYSHDVTVATARTIRLEAKRDSAGGWSASSILSDATNGRTTLSYQKIR